jgi:CMP-N,N'-diacetyllegionaminic acid synthase
LSINKPKVLAIIPAREGSKRVKHKNFRPFAGTTLVDIAIEQSLAAKTLTDIVLSTDSKDVLEIGRKYPDIICLERPVEISDDKSPAIDYVKHTLAVLEPQKGYIYDMVVIIQPSSPLRTPQDIDKTVELLIANPNKESSVSVVLVDHMIHPLKLKVMQGDTLLPYLEEEKGRFASHELPDIYVRNCAVYVTRRECLENRVDVISPNSVGYVMSSETSVDINSMLDFELGEHMYKKKYQQKS